MIRRQISSPRVLLKRFAIPVIAAWLIYLGAFSVVFTVSQPILSSLLGIVNWYTQHFRPTGNLVEEAWWNFPLWFKEIAEGLIPIVLGLLLGLWALARKRRSGTLAVGRD